MKSERKVKCGWCTGPPGARPAHCFGKKAAACNCPCVKTLT